MAALTPEVDDGGPQRHLLVFAGSSGEDVSHARIFWNSVTLQPPLESRLVSGDIAQRLRVAPPPAQQINVAHQLPPLDYKIEQVILESQKELKAEQKVYYLEKAKKREEIIALLKKQREDRIKKEQISLPHKPKITAHDLRPMTSDHGNEELEEVKTLPQFD